MADEIDDSDEICTHCGHTWGPHVLVATMFSPEHGGLVFCDQLGCLCQTTWSVDDGPMPWIPDDEEVARLRLVAQDPTIEAEEWDLDDGKNPRIQ